MMMLLLSGVTEAGASREMLAFEIDGQERSVLLYTPRKVRDAPAPLVVVFHGRGDEATNFAEAVKFHREWPEAIVAYPQGEFRPDSDQRGWQYRAGGEGDRDLRLVDRLLADLQARFGTRPEQTFAAGFSNGGHFTFLLMDQRPAAFDRFAVIGSVRPDFASEAPPRPVMYLFGSGEDPAHRDSWEGTVAALVRHNRTQGAATDYLSCCRLQEPGPGGAPLAIGVYRAGHVWPFRGNEWLRAFFEEDWDEAVR